MHASTSYKSDEAFSESLILEAGKLAREIMQAGYTTDWKSDNTPVTTIDKKINDLLIERIKAIYPDDRIYGEEKSAEGSSGFTWIADPLDGTQSLGLFPTATICLARTSPDGQPLFSYILNPITGELFSASGDGVAYANGKPLHVSGRETVKGSYVFLGSRLPNGTASNGILYDRLEGEGAKIINVRSLAFGCCMVAAGKAEAALVGVHTPFESAAVKLLIEHAGGTVTDLFGHASGSFRYDTDVPGLVVSNGKLHEKVLAAVLA